MAQTDRPINLLLLTRSDGEVSLLSTDFIPIEDDNKMFILSSLEVKADLGGVKGFEWLKASLKLGHGNKKNRNIKP